MADELQVNDYERARIQTEALVPVIRAFQAEFGVQRTNEIVEEAMSKRWREEFAAMAEEAAGDPIARVAALNREYEEAGAIGCETLREDNEAFDANITVCRFTEMMKELNALDLGPLLLCNADFICAEEMGMELKRTQLCMQGAPYCDFRWHLRKQEQ